MRRKKQTIFFVSSLASYLLSDLKPYSSFCSSARMADSHLRLRKRQTTEEEQGSPPPCDLQVVGLHTRLFDDDHLAAFINSPDALLPWNRDEALLIDRYDVRHLLQDLTGIRKRRARPPLLDVTQEELDYERYSDLKDLEDTKTISEDILKPTAGSSHDVQFSYSAKIEDRNIVESGSRIADYKPPFPVPNLPSLKRPPFEKVHQIIARTAKFVSEHGGQSEVILRVKQGDNPMFSFLNPDDHLHEYFRYLVQHPELSGAAEKTQVRLTESLKHTSEGLSLLGSTYESDDDNDDDCEAVLTASPEKDKSSMKGSAQFNKVENVAANFALQEAECMPPRTIEEVVPTKESANNALPETSCTSADYKSEVSLKENMRKIFQPVLSETAGTEQCIAAANVLAFPAKATMLEPPLQLKRIIDKTADFIAQSGKELESLVKDRVKTDRRFWFFLPWNEYHAYYLQALESAQKVKRAVHAPNVSEIDMMLKSTDAKEETSACVHRAETSQSLCIQKNSNLLIGSNKMISANGSANSDKKKMKIMFDHKDVSQHVGFRKKLCDAVTSHATVTTGQLQIGTGSKTDGDEKAISPSNPQVTEEHGMSLDAAAAVVMAATRGARRQKKDCSESEAASASSLHERLVRAACSSLGTRSEGLSTSDGCVEVVGSSKLQRFSSGLGNADVIIAKAIAHAAALATAHEADSADAGLTPAEKLKAERLRRAKMFTAMIKSGKSFPESGIEVGGALVGVLGRTRVDETSEVAVQDMVNERKDADLIASSKYDTDAKCESRYKRYNRSDYHDEEPRKKRSHHDDRSEHASCGKFNKSSRDSDEGYRKERLHRDHKDKDYHKGYHDDKYDNKEHDRKGKSNRMKEKSHNGLKEHHGKSHHHADLEKNSHDEKRAQGWEKKQKHSRIRDLNGYKSCKTENNQEVAVCTNAINHKSIEEKKIMEIDSTASQETLINSSHLAAETAGIPGSADTSLTAEDIPDDIRAKVRKMLLSNLK